jgi:propanediol dehydratase small subunit
MSQKNYPLGQHHADEIRSHTGVALEQFTLEAVAGGEIGPGDATIHRETLEMQARIAGESGYPELAENLKRAAELTDIPNQRILEIYEALRPRRRTYFQLLALSQEIAGMYGADATARYIREAADAYRDTGLLKAEE